MPILSNFPGGFDPSVPAWAKEPNKPTYTAAEVGAAAESHTHAQSDVTGLTEALVGKADAGHTHDDRYYTETEIEGKNYLQKSGGTMTGILTAVADTTPATAKVRNSSLHSTETAPTANGTIAWTYE